MKKRLFGPGALAAITLAVSGSTAAQSISAKDTMTLDATAIRQSSEQIHAKTLASDPSMAFAQSDPVQDDVYPSYGFTETDVLHYNLALDWDGSTLTGVTTAEVRAAKETSTIRLNLANQLNVSRIEVEEKEATFKHSNNILTIDVEKRSKDDVFTLKISYAGKPQSIKMPSPRGNILGWNVSRDGSVSTMQEPYGAFTWYPNHDHPSDKAYYDATITTREGVMGVFNGVMMDKYTENGKTTSEWHLDKPAASYLTTIAIDPFKVDEQQMEDGRTFYIWYTDEDTKDLERYRKESKAAYDWLVKHAGENPFESMGMVIVDAGSAMETQTMMTMGRRFLRSNTKKLISHEMAHQWYGNTVTTKTWKDMWLNEGWTMYMDHAYNSGVNVSASARACKRDVRGSGQAGNPNPNSFAMPNVYECPVPALHEIRQDIGDEKFFDAVAQQWPSQHAYTSQDRKRFTSFLRDATGNDYSNLLATWLDKVSAANARDAHHQHLQPNYESPLTNEANSGNSVSPSAPNTAGASPYPGSGLLP